MTKNDGSDRRDDVLVVEQQPKVVTGTGTGTTRKRKMRKRRKKKNIGKEIKINSTSSDDDGAVTISNNSSTGTIISNNSTSTSSSSSSSSNNPNQIDNNLMGTCSNKKVKKKKKKCDRKQLSKKNQCDAEEDNEANTTTAATATSTITSECKGKGKGKGNQNRNPKQRKEKKRKKDEIEVENNFETDPTIIKKRLMDRIKICTPSFNNPNPNSNSNSNANLPPLMKKQKNSFQLEWNTQSVSQKDEDRIREKVVVKGQYGRLDEEDLGKIQNFILSTSINMTIQQAISLRSSLLQEKACFQNFHLQKYAKQLYKEYKEGKTIIQLSQSTDNPPLNVLRMVLKQMKCGKDMIKKSFRDPKKHLKERECTELFAARALDIVSTGNNQEVIKKLADVFEDNIADFLQEKGIAFVGEKQLINEQNKEFGKSILTPDFLLLDKVTINGQIVTWIDAKAFYGAKTKLSMQNLKKQTKRYIDMWGNGAIIYLQGFSENTCMDGCTMLNARDFMNAENVATLENQMYDAINAI